MEATDQGIDGGGHTKTARGPFLGAAWLHSAVVGSVVPGSTRSIELAVSAGLAQDRFLRCRDPRAGGDEETRTPDPLLAKEMLCQLSYVPLPGRVWWAFLDSNQRPLPYQGSALTS